MKAGPHGGSGFSATRGWEWVRGNLQILILGQLRQFLLGYFRLCFPAVALAPHEHQLTFKLNAARAGWPTIIPGPMRLSGFGVGAFEHHDTIRRNSLPTPTKPRGRGSFTSSMIVRNCQPALRAAALNSSSVTSRYVRSTSSTSGGVGFIGIKSGAREEPRHRRMGKRGE